MQQLCKSCMTCFKFYYMFYFTCDCSFRLAEVLVWRQEGVAVDVKAAELTQFCCDVTPGCRRTELENVGLHGAAKK